MMKPFRMFAYFIVTFSFTIAFAQAQDEAALCSALVENALDDMQEVCMGTGRNQACYGNMTLSATPREGVENFSFSSPGDLVDVADINTLRLSAFDSVNNTWGITLINLQANLPDTLPGQSVTFLLFGNVEIQNDVPPSDTEVTVVLTASSYANIRSAPSTSAAVIGSLAQGDTAIADGRNADSTWLHIQIPGTNAVGWVSANLVTAQSDVSVLRDIDTTEAEIPFQPMQAFYFKTGITSPQCAEVPPDGILIQTPTGAGQINLRANDVEIQLGSTAFLQAIPSANMTISVLEGEGRVTVGDQTVVVPAGSQVNIPVDADARPTGTIDNPQPYDESLVARLPVQYLPEPITVVLLGSDAQLATLTPSSPSGDFSSFTGERKRAFCGYIPLALTMAITSHIPSPSEYLAEQYPELVDDEQLLAALSQSEQVVREFVEQRVRNERYEDEVDQFCDS
jgi:hypothetical protein